MAEFSAAINEDRPPLTDAEAGVRVLALLEAASLSAASDGATGRSWRRPGPWSTTSSRRLAPMAERMLAAEAGAR